MTGSFYSVEQVAEHLGLHVRTVRNYVRDGRLPAIRIGKQYRIAHEDLEAFTGRPVPAPRRDAPRRDAAGRQRHTEVSSIVEIDAIGPETADRLGTLLVSSATGHRPGGQRLRIETVYDAERGRMKIVILGGLSETARLLDYVEGVLGS
ncbi:helix-turn-helix domain-containing protein [Planomonospora corallina]|uniref:Helix-turn-helix domain-containing protein n=1 Tax=Planomonospora corallina TaxID=1806052 RepID=A0ABV8I8H1_9ACTN